MPVDPRDPRGAGHSVGDARGLRAARAGGAGRAARGARRGRPATAHAYLRYHRRDAAQGILPILSILPTHLLNRIKYPCVDGLPQLFLK